MRLEQFQLLDSLNQVDYILQQGAFLHCKQNATTTTDFYEVENLLVELNYATDTDILLSVTAHDILEWLKKAGRHQLQPRLVVRNNHVPEIKKAA